MSTPSHCCVILGKISAIFECNSIPKWRQLCESGAIVPFGHLRLALLDDLPLPIPPLRLKHLCFNTEYRCLRDDPLVRCEPIRSPYTNAFVDHRRAIASSVHDCAPPTNLVFPSFPSSLVLPLGDGRLAHLW
jgi:hypothetical protein